MLFNLCVGNHTSQLELSDREVKLLCEHSLERALKLALEVCEVSRHRDAQNAIDDLRDLSKIAAKTWHTFCSTALAESWEPTP